MKRYNNSFNSPDFRVKSSCSCPENNGVGQMSWHRYESKDVGECEEAERLHSGFCCEHSEISPLCPFFKREEGWQYLCVVQRSQDATASEFVSADASVSHKDDIFCK